jgi:cellulose synthase/poly-beta-1,6-N-acetylglucosamine synthase-like glycosyltransferase
LLKACLREFVLTPDKAPRVSFVVFTYNQESFVREAVTGAFMQDYPNLQIILSDDCSSDGTFALLQELAAAYRGPHRVLVNQTPQNRGSLAHLYHAASRCDGELVICAAGDDISLSDRVTRTVADWHATGADALFSKYDLIDAAGKVIERDYRFDNSWLPHASYLPGRNVVPIHGASSAYARRLFATVPLPDEPILFEDTYMTLFIALAGGSVHFIDKALVRYRRHDSSATNADVTRSSYAVVRDRERRSQHYARSWLVVLERFRAAAVGDPTVDFAKIDHDLAFSRLQSNWMEKSVGARLAALGRTRRGWMLRWVLARLAGVPGLFAARRVRAMLSRR